MQITLDKNARSFLSRIEWFPTLLVLLAVLARLIPGARTIDDSFITFRYAHNILAGNGFTFNPGEQVLGTTTPLYTILLVILGYFTGGPQAPFPQIALAVNALADALTCLLLYDLGRRLGSMLVGTAAALVWAVAPFSVTFAIGGLETSVYVLLITVTMHAHLSGRRLWAAFLAALSLLTRPDALIFLGLLALDRFILWIMALRTNADPLPVRILTNPPSSTATTDCRIGGELAAFLLPLLPWLIFSTLFFGSPLPHSIAAKSVAYRLPADAAFTRLLQHYATPFMDNLVYGVAAIAVGLVIYPFLFLIGASQALKATRRSWPMLVYPWLYFAVFSIANPLIFRWYLTPPLPFYILIILLGLAGLLRDLLARWSNKIKSIQVVRVLGILIPFFFSCNGWTLHPDHGLSNPAPKMAYYQLELLYRQAADLLAPEISLRSKPPLLAAGDVGVLGYYTQARILDTVGLNSPVSTRYYPFSASLYTINYAIPPNLILDTQPDYLVILEVYGREGLLKNYQFLKTYHLRTKISTDMYGSDGLLIFERNP